MPQLQKIALITGAAKRIGAEIARTLHAAGFGVVLHFNESESAAKRLEKELNERRKGSAWTVKANLHAFSNIRIIIDSALNKAGRLDVLVNNASGFDATPMGSISEQQWDALMSSNLKAAFFLSQAVSRELKSNQGCIVNIIDIYAEKPLLDFPVYSIAKSGLLAMTRSLAKELSPEIRVNGVSPGVILWPEESSDTGHDEVLLNIPLQKKGEPSDVAKTVLFLAQDAPYITGQVIAVDGGKSLM